MSNTYTFTYNSEPAEDNAGSPFPSHTRLSATYEVSSDQPWKVILWQFCKFLEHTGFTGVCDRVKIDMLKTDDWLFESCYDGRDDDLFFGKDEEETGDWPFPLDNEDKDAQ